MSTNTEKVFSASDLKPTPNRITDKDGEVVDISNLRFIAYNVVPELPPMPADYHDQMALKLAQAATFEKRTLAFHKKLAVLWRIFMHLFFDKPMEQKKQVESLVVSLEKIFEPKPKTVEQRWNIFKNHLRDYFIVPKNVVYLRGVGGYGLNPRINQVEIKKTTPPQKHWYGSGCNLETEETIGD